VSTALTKDEPVIRAKLLRALCEDEELGLDPSGVHVTGAVVEGQLDLRWLEFARPLTLEDCDLEETVLLANASAKSIAFLRCRLNGGLDASRLSVDAGLLLSGKVGGPVRLAQASVGTLDCTGIDLHAPGVMWALDASNLTAESDVRLAGATVEGGMSLVGAQVGGNVDCRASRFEYEGAVALSLDGAVITGGLVIGPWQYPTHAVRTEIQGRLSLLGVKVGRNLECHGTRIDAGGNLAVVGDGARVGGTLGLGQALGYDGGPLMSEEGRPLRFEAIGGVRFRQARVEDVDMTGGRFVSPGGLALDLAGIKVAGPAGIGAWATPAQLAPGVPTFVPCEIEGQLSLVGAKLGSQLLCSGARLTMPNGVALMADHAEIAGVVVLGVSPGGMAPRPGGDDELRFTSQGALSFGHAHIGSLDARGARLENEGGIALSIYRATVAGDVDMGYVEGVAREASAAQVLRFEATGQVLVESATVHGRLLCTAARISAAPASAISGYALTVSAGVHLGPALDRAGALRVDAHGDPLRFDCKGGVWLSNAQLGSFDASGASIDADGAYALLLPAARVAGDLTARPVLADPEQGGNLPFEARGEVSLVLASVGGALDLTGARLNQPGGLALRANFLKLSGAMSLDHAYGADGSLLEDADHRPIRLEAHGGVWLSAAELGELSCSGALFDNPDGIALDLRSASIGGSAYLGPAVGPASAGAAPGGERTWAQAFECNGQAWLASATVRRDMTLIGVFNGSAGSAVTADQIAIGGTLFMGTARDPHGAWVLDERGPLRLEADGIVSFIAARLSGSADLSGATLRSSAGDALRASGIEVRGHLWLGAAVGARGDLAEAGQGGALVFSSTGTVRLDAATIGGQLNCAGGRFESDGGDALTIQATHVTGDIALAAVLDLERALMTDTEGKALCFRSSGSVRLNGTTTDASFIARGGSFQGGDRGPALDASGMVVRGDAELDVVRGANGEPLAGAPTFEAAGELLLRGMTVGGSLLVRGATLHGWPGPALDAEGLHVGRTFDWRQVSVSGDVSLRDGSVKTLRDDATSWGLRGGQCRLDLDGFTYSALTAGSLTQEERQAWLAKQREHSTRPYRQLVEIYRAAGDDRSARRIAMAQFDEQLRREDVPTGRRERVGRKVLGTAVGHGYEPWRAIRPAIVLLLLGWLAVHLALDANAVVPTRAATTSEQAQKDKHPRNCARPDYPCVEPLLFAADMIVPIVDLGQRDNWRLAGGLHWRLVGPLLTILGWILTTLIVAAFTGLVRRE
jgi:hypothetical protein